MDWHTLKDAIPHPATLVADLQELLADEVAHPGWQIDALKREIVDPEGQQRRSLDLTHINPELLADQIGPLKALADK